MLRLINTRIMMALMLLALVPMSACKDDDEPIQADTMQSIEITYTYTISEDILNYFNITAMYENTAGEQVSQQMNERVLEIKTSASKFPATRRLWFNVTRKDVAGPSIAPVWSASMSISVVKRYYPSGNVETSSKNEANSYSPKPEKFAEWSALFIKNMATGYNVTISTDGSVTF